MIISSILISVAIFLPVLIPALFVKESHIRALGSGYVTHVFRGSTDNATVSSFGNNGHGVSFINKGVVNRYRVDIGTTRPIVKSVTYSAEGFTKTLAENDNRVETCTSFDDQLDIMHPNIWMLGNYCSTNRHNLLRSQKRMLFWTTITAEIIIVICYVVALCSSPQ